MRPALFAAVLLCAVAPAFANDSMAELKTGGLSYVRTDAVRMLREDLFVSLDLVTVDYVYENTTDEDVDTIVAFPMPDITGDPYEMPAVPDSESDNFLGFSVHSEDVAITPELMQRATAFGIDVTADLKAHGIALNPFARDGFNALAALDPATLGDWTARGIVMDDVYDDGSGMKSHPTPIWTLHSEYWWRMTFPAHAKVSLGHAYTPSVGASVGLGFLSPPDVSADNPQRTAYVEKYCIDDGFMRAAKARIANGSASISAFYENWLSYILTTANNWAGPIGTFHLTIDKGSPNNLVSFCGSGVKKTGPTRFELTYTDYYPERDLDVLILKEVE